jgi:hypothetical membrane protein
MVVVGALDVAAGYVFYRWHRRRWLFALFALAGVGTAAVGVFPSSTGAAHAAAALVAFVGFNLQTAGSATRVAGPLRPLGLGAGALGLVALAWFVGGGGSPAAYGALGYGGVERLVVYPGVLWTVALCGALLGRLRGEPKH